MYWLIDNIPGTQCSHRTATGWPSARRPPVRIPATPLGIRANRSILIRPSLRTGDPLLDPSLVGGSKRSNCQITAKESYMLCSMHYYKWFYFHSDLWLLASELQWGINSHYQQEHHSFSVKNNLTEHHFLFLIGIDSTLCNPNDR